MTMEPAKPEPDAMSELTSHWFDSESNDAVASPSSLDMKQRHQAADLQLIHSLLTQLADFDQDAKEQQIQQLMQRIAHEDKGSMPGLTKVTHWVRLLGRYGIAALVLLGLIVFVTQISTVTANEAMKKMISAMDLAGDRIYTIHSEEDGGDGRGRFALPPDPNERAILDGSTLYLRSPDQFVLFRPTPSGKILINGRDGQAHWMIRPDKPVMISSDPDAFPIPMPQKLAAILSLDLKTTLQHISKHYQVKLLDKGDYDKSQDGSRIYLDAVKVNPDMPGPQNIILWAELQTGLLLRIEFADIPIDGNPMPGRVIIELTEQTALAEDWFTRQTHHALDVEVIDITGQQPKLAE